jgi:hypothetical protein
MGTTTLTDRSLYVMFRFRFTRLLMWIGLAAVATYQMRQKSKKVGKEISKKAGLA